MAGCPSGQVNALIGLINCGAWFVMVGVGVVTTVVVIDVVSDTIVGDGVIIVGITSVVVGTNSDVSITVMLLVISICVVMPIDVISVAIAVDGSSMILVTDGVNTCEDNITSVVLTIGSVIDGVTILVTEGVMKLVSLIMGEGVTNSTVLVLVVTMLESIVTMLDMIVGAGVTITVVVVCGDVGTLLMDGIVTLVSISVMVGETTSLVGLLVRLGNIVKSEVTTVGTLDGIIKLSVFIGVIVGETSSVGLVKLKLGVKIGLDSIVEGKGISVLFITMDGIVKLSVSISVTVGEITSLVGLLIRLGGIVEGEAISVGTLLFITMDGMVKLSVSINVIVGEISPVGLVKIKLGVGILLGNIVEGKVISVGTLLFITMDGMVKLSISVMVGEITSLVRLGNIVKGEVVTVGTLDGIIKLSVSIGVIVDNSSVGLVEIKLGVKIRLGSIEGKVITVATSLVFIMSLTIVIGITIAVLTSVVKVPSLMLTGGSVGVLEIFKIALGVKILVTLDDGEKEGTTLVLLNITLVTEGVVILSVSINGIVVVGEITSLTSLVTTLLAIITDVGITGRVKIVPVVSSILTTSLLVTLSIVMTLEITNDGAVVKAIVSVIGILVSITMDGVSTVTNIDGKLVTEEVLIGI